APVQQHGHDQTADAWSEQHQREDRTGFQRRQCRKAETGGGEYDQDATPANAEAQRKTANKTAAAEPGRGTHAGVPPLNVLAGFWRVRSRQHCPLIRSSCRIGQARPVAKAPGEVGMSACRLIEFANSGRNLAVQDRAPQAKATPTRRAKMTIGNIARPPRTKLVAAKVQLRVPLSMSLT